MTDVQNTRRVRESSSLADRTWGPIRRAGRDCVGQIGSKRLYAPTDRAADDKAISGDNSVDGRRERDAGPE